MIQSHGYFRTRTCGQDIPCLALAVRQTDRAREHIIRMHLNRERRAREDQLEKQGRARSLRVGAFEPSLTYRGVGIVVDVPGPQVRATPGLGYEADSGLLDCHEVYQVDDVWVEDARPVERSRGAGGATVIPTDHRTGDSRQNLDDEAFPG